MRRAGPVLMVGALLAAGVPVRGAAQCADGSPPPCRVSRPVLDSARYVILPFAHREGSQATMLDGADCAELMSEAFDRWLDVRLADRTRVHDALARRAARAPFRMGFGTGLAIARELGAGRLVMGQLWSFADTLHLTVGVYDAARGGPPLKEAKQRVPASSERASAAFNALADSLVAADLGAVVGMGADQTRSTRALHAYSLGERAMRAWDLAGAARQLRSAVAADSNFAHAYVSLGQALLWATDSTAEAMRDRTAIARRTRALVERLGATDRSLLLAQQAMFQRRWPDACERYREVLKRDSLSFDAWYGLAQCNADDPVVIRDPADSTRFVFRGSWHSAEVAYAKALMLAPSFNFAFGTHAREQLARLLLAEEFWWREGRLDTLPYFGFPAIEGDTLAFYPVSGATIAQGGARPKTQALALARNRQVLVEVTAAWADAFPREPLAHRALAYGLEVTGKIAPIVGEPRTALGEVAQGESIVVLERRIESILGTVPPAERGSARSSLLDLPAELVFEDMGLQSAHRTTPPGPDRTMAMQWALAHGDTAFVRANIDTLGGSHDYAYLRARLALAVGDTATAQAQLDRALSNLPSLYSALLDYVPLPGCFVRIMAWRSG